MVIKVLRVLNELLDYEKRYGKNPSLSIPRNRRPRLWLKEDKSDDIHDADEEIVSRAEVIMDEIGIRVVTP